MKFYRGHTRLVIIIGPFAIKIAKIHFIKAFKAFKWHAVYLILWLLGKVANSKNKPLLLRKDLFNYRRTFTPTFYLLGGIMANNWERRLYRQTKNSILMPTHFSLLGLVNIQDAGQILEMSDTDCWCQIVGLTSQNEAFCDSHLFSNYENFCWVDGHLKINDYGNDRCHDFLKKYGQKIWQEFSLDYS